MTVTVVTGKDGRYSFPAVRLAPGQYSLHIRAAGRDEGLWRISLDAVDAWTAGAASDNDKGPFARLLSD